MPDMPNVSPGDQIMVGEKGNVHAVVCNVYDGMSANGGNIEVVYLDNRNRAINEDVKWMGTYWEFAIKGPCGGYADNYDRLRHYVGILRASQSVVRAGKKGLRARKVNGRRSPHSPGR